MHRSIPAANGGRPRQNQAPGKLEIVPKRGEHAPFEAWLSYVYLPAVQKTQLEIPTRGIMKRLGEISKVLGPYADLSALEERLDAMTTDELDLLAKAIELQRSHFLSEGRLPRDPRSMSRDLRVGSNERLSP